MFFIYCNNVFTSQVYCFGLGDGLRLNTPLKNLCMRGCCDMSGYPDSSFMVFRALLVIFSDPIPILVSEISVRNSYIFSIVPCKGSYPLVPQNIFHFLSGVLYRLFVLVLCCGSMCVKVLILGNSRTQTISK